MNKEKLKQEANKARIVAVTLAENIYRYLGGIIAKEELKAIVDSAMSDDIITRFDHMYIKKDTYKNTFVCGFLDDDAEITADDTDTLIIKDSKGE